MTACEHEDALHWVDLVTERRRLRAEVGELRRQVHRLQARVRELEAPPAPGRARRRRRWPR